MPWWPARSHGFKPDDVEKKMNGMMRQEELVEVMKDGGI